MSSPFGATEYQQGPIAEVAKILGVTTDRARELAQRSDFPPFRGHDENWRELWDLDDVRAWDLMFGG
jgi:hypothetical protein